MKIQVIQHSAADTPARAGEIVHQLGHTIETVRLDRNASIPREVSADALMMFGGGASLTSPDRPPWVAQEQELIRRYVDDGRRVMGICFGSQILASALGADVKRNACAEVGWHEIVRVDDGNDAKVASALPPRMTAFHWHQDTFGIPAGATRLYESQACENQAFTIDDRVFGFQFHFEANPKTVSTFLAVSSIWKQDAPHVQSEEQINRGTELHAVAQTAALQRFLEKWLPSASCV